MEGSNEQAAAELDGDGGAEGRNGQLHFLATHLSLSQPLSSLLGGPGTQPQITVMVYTRCHGACQCVRSCQLLKLQEKNVGRGLARVAQGLRSLGEGERTLSASYQPGAEDGMGCWLHTSVSFQHCCISVVRMESGREMRPGASGTRGT